MEMLTKLLQEQESQAAEKIQGLKQQLQEKDAQMACMASWTVEALQCTKLAKSYALYLKDKWLQFQINTLAQRGTIAFQNYHYFMDLCDSSSAEDKAKLSKFYLHNLALPNMNLWDPNATLGDVQVMAMASWLNHEEKREVEIWNVMNMELSEPLMIKAELEDPSALLYAHHHLANNPQVLPDYIEKQSQAIAHIEDMERLLGDKCIHACTRRWNTLSHSLKINEYTPQQE